MKEKNKSILKSVIAIIIAFIITFALACLNICITGKAITNSNFARKIVVKSDYVNNATSEIKEGLSDLAIPSGLPSDFFDNKVTTTLVSDLVLSSIDYHFISNAQKPDFSYIKETLEKDITDYANENFVSIDQDTKSAIKTLTDECYKVYLRYCNPELIEVLGNTVKLLSKVVNLGIIASSVLFVLALLFIYRLVSLKSFFFYSFVSFMSAGLLTGIIPLLLLITNKISQIAILSKTLYSFLCSFVNSSLSIVLLISVLFIIISLVILFLELKQK